MKVVYVFFLAVLVPALLSCSDDETTSPETGTITAVVTDSMVGAVAGVEITLLPLGIVEETGEDGRAVFTVPVGNYFVDAKVCCIGPGWFDYHIAVKVEAGKTVEVEMAACLACV